MSVYEPSSEEFLPEAAQLSRVPKQQRSIRTINRILDAAAECICEMGYVRSSTMEIAKRAGVSQGAIFRHFATRVDLCVAVAARQMSRYRSLFEGSLQASTDPAAQRRDAMAFVRWAVLSDDSLVLLELADAARSDAELAARYTPLWKELHREILSIAGGLSWPEGIEQEQIEAVVFVALRMWEGWARIKRFGGAEVDDLDGLADRAHQMLLEYLEFYLAQVAARSLDAPPAGSQEPGMSSQPA